MRFSVGLWLWQSCKDFLMRCHLPWRKMSLVLQGETHFLVDAKLAISEGRWVNQFMKYRLHYNWFSNPRYGDLGFKTLLWTWRSQLIVSSLYIITINCVCYLLIYTLQIQGLEGIKCWKVRDGSESILKILNGLDKSWKGSKKSRNVWNKKSKTFD